ncbi:flagellar filament capping protein FliD [Kineococcus rhizosphaerae]|uniref:Flagellar hook-associated protein 2 n=1 Tax=Kineococcus rhizosphaerae TaxID=559628 RepID=A0A2T0RAP9_9ACTN|nr:flagellar filament capping protein FliD [Kineococcus rhizosphaerae]PRY18246.1 flagellar hook-associated protein 2 [Kineococcus rhizosphaerae]
MVSSVSSSAVDGLVSGLDTASIISQLLQVDAAPQTQMKNSVSTAQAKVTALQSVNSKMSALQTAAQNLTKASTWVAATATSSADGVTATAGTTAAPGTVNVYVQNLATSRSVITPTVLSTDKDAAGTLGFPLDVVDTHGTLVGTIRHTTGTLSEVAAEINKASSKLGITAVALRVSDGTYRLQVTSTKSGKDSEFHLVPSTEANVDPADIAGLETGAAPGGLALTQMAPAQDATLYLTPGAVPSGGAVPPGSIPVTSSTNTFADLMQGVTVTATKVGGATVSVAANPSAVSDSVKALVDAANAALSTIASVTKAGTISASGTNSGSGPLNGNATLRALKTQILDVVTTRLGGGSVSSATYGIQSTRDGQLSFDADTFKAAYTADAATTQKMVAPTSIDSSSPTKGLVDGFIAVAQKATGISPVTNVASGKGSLELAIQGQNSTISDLSQRISDWDVRLAAKRTYYQKYYSNLEVALGKLQSQSSWLSGQLSSLSS